MEERLENKNVLITGGAGFIGSYLLDRLIEEANEIIVLDNLNTGKKEFIRKHFLNPKFKFYKIDLLNQKIDKYFKNVDEVWHIAANPDIRVAIQNTRTDLEQNTLVTYNVLEAMRKNKVEKIFFTSSSTVYGDAEILPTPEDYGKLIPISLYGASKLASEALISAYCNSFEMKAVVFRLANIIGSRSNHGVIYDFVNKLRKTPDKLEILGDGNQKKSYIHIEDCIEAMLIGTNNLNKNFDIFNIGSDSWISVKEIAKIICNYMKLNSKFEFTDGKRGWIGDVPLMLLDISKIKNLGFKLKYNTKQSIKKVLKEYVN